MLALIEDLPTNVVGFRASGHVEAADYQEVLDPAIEQALDEHDKVRFLYVLGSDFEGYSPGAMWEDTKVGVDHWTHWEKIGLVTDNDAYHHAVKAVAWMIPGEVRLFPLDDLDAATQWITS